MNNNLRQLLRHDSGAAAVEFVIAAPVVLVMIFGIIQLSTIMYARNGLQEAVEAGARYATIYPKPTDAQIIAKVTASKFGLDPSHVIGPTLYHGTTNGISYVDVTMTYSAPVNFTFFKGPTVTFSRTRRAYQP